MKKENNAHHKSAFERFATKATQAAGSTTAFIIAFSVVLIWVATGPIFKFSDTWQLVINTGTTIVTFLMVFLIQKTQNKDSLAMQIKLNELVAVSEKASNRVMDAEDLTEEELRVLHKYYTKLTQLAKKDTKIQMSHSIEEAMEKHESKLQYIPKNKPTKKDES